MKNKITIKSESDIKKMAEGGKKLYEIKKALVEKIEIGISASEIEKLADMLIKKSGGKASFKMVPRYSWSTCINVNSGVVHGIPHKHLKFRKGDIVSIDVGFFYKGFHTDTSITIGLGVDKKKQKFLEAGKRALNGAINEAVVGNRIYDISKVIQNYLEGSGYQPIQALVGHGVGKELHEGPQIPCFVVGSRKETPEIYEGMVFAIEVMYTMGDPKIKIDKDGWTISTRDGKISALFEETVAVTKERPIVLTREANYSNN
jgi:methionyl aminopeptidase